MSADVIEVMRGAKPFSRLNDDELQAIAGHLERKEYAAGETVFSEGDPSDAVFVIVKGGINVIKGGETIASLPQGTIVGEIGLLLEHHSRSATAQAEGATVLMRLESSDFHRRLEEQEPAALKIALDVAHQLAERLKRMTDEFMKINDKLKLDKPKKASEFEDFKNRMLNEVLF